MGYCNLYLHKSTALTRQWPGTSLVLVITCIWQQIRTILSFTDRLMNTVADGGLTMIPEYLLLQYRHLIPTDGKYIYKIYWVAWLKLDLIIRTASDVMVINELRNAGVIIVVCIHANFFNSPLQRLSTCRQQWMYLTQFYMIIMQLAGDSISI